MSENQSTFNKALDDIAHIWFNLSDSDSNELVKVLSNILECNPHTLYSTLTNIQCLKD